MELSLTVPCEPTVNERSVNHLGLEILFIVKVTEAVLSPVWPKAVNSSFSSALVRLCLEYSVCFQSPHSKGAWSLFRGERPEWRSES